MNVRRYRHKTRRLRILNRIRHPWPFYKKAGGINAVVIRANGDREDLGRVSDTYSKRWGVGTRD